MPRLILLNGPPGCGKSTLARRYVDEHPLALNLDIDRVRDLIGRWSGDPHAAGLLAREIALAAARAHLVSGHDVVVPQFLGRLTFIERLERLAGEVGAAFHEIVLLDSKESALRRFTERGRLAAEPAHLEAREMLDRGGGLAELSAMYDGLVSVVAARPRARIVHSEDGEVDASYRGLVGHINEREATVQALAEAAYHQSGAVAASEPEAEDRAFIDALSCERQDDPRR